MNVIETSLPDVKLLEPRVFHDDRGFFFEDWNAKLFASLGLDMNFVQDNHSLSAKGVLRGLHYQITQPQGKLLRVAVGAVFDVAVDIRKASASFGRSVCVELAANRPQLLWVPAGFAHGFLSLEEGTQILYKCTDYYNPASERTLLWSDPALGIDWPLHQTGQPRLSPKDVQGKRLQDCEVYYR